MTIKNEIGERIRTRRLELSMSQEELANKMGFKTRSSINKIEKGVNDIPHSKVSILANALDTTESYLMGFDVSMDILQFLYNNPEYKVLFDAVSKVKLEDINFVKEIIERMTNSN